MGTVKLLKTDPGRIALEKIMARPKCYYEKLKIKSAAHTQEDVLTEASIHE